MAGTGTKLWATGDLVTASHFQTYLQDQVVAVFADSSARDAAFGGTGEPSLAEGLVCFLKDTNELQIYSGSAWVPIIDLDTFSVSSGDYSISGASLSVDKDSADAVINLTAHHDTEATAAEFVLRKTDGSKASPALVDDDAVLGKIMFQGYDGNSYANGAQIRAQVDGTPADGDMPTEMIFMVTADGGSETPATAVTIKPSKAAIFEKGVFAKDSIQTGLDSFYGQDSYEPWNAATIALGNFGNIGTQGSYRTTMGWNWERSSDNDYKHLDVNSYPQAGAVEIGNSGILFRYHDDYENNHTTLPTLVGYWNADGCGSYVKFRTDGMSGSSANEVFDMPEQYGLYADNTGPGTANSRFWLNGVDGAACYIGPRAGAHTWNLIRLSATTISLLGTVSKSFGTFDIKHPTKGGDWRLRHSFIEGPTADNLYRGHATIENGTTTVDLDSVSGMTDGTWEALNTNGWAMVSSSGNAVTWDLDGKNLTIEGPDGAVCSWLVIGERQDEFMKSDESTSTNSDGKLIVEYENPDAEYYPDEEPSEEAIDPRQQPEEEEQDGV